MTVKELIQELQALDENAEVFFAHPSHDYWRSELASEVVDIRLEPLKHSEYHRQMVTVDEDKWDEVEDEQDYVILRSA